MKEDLERTSHTGVQGSIGALNKGGMYLWFVWRGCREGFPQLRSLSTHTSLGASTYLIAG